MESNSLYISWEMGLQERFTWGHSNYFEDQLKKSILHTRRMVQKTVIGEADKV